MTDVQYETRPEALVAEDEVRDAARRPVEAAKEELERTLQAHLARIEDTIQRGRREILAAFVESEAAEVHDVLANSPHAVADLRRRHDALKRELKYAADDLAEFERAEVAAGYAGGKIDGKNAEVRRAAEAAFLAAHAEIQRRRSEVRRLEQRLDEAAADLDHEIALLQAARYRANLLAAQIQALLKV
jgi:predicted  nucleic acid-binding Zn-ribbon protein